MSFNLVDLYYENTIGTYPEDDERIKYMKLTFEYLLESGLSYAEIINLILFDLKNIDDFSICDLPEKLWEDSLLEKDTFYYHRELQIISPRPTLTEKFPFYLEMKIKYKEEDIIKYFIKTFNVREEWFDKEKETGSLKYLLKNYQKYDFIKPVDFILNLMDYAKNSDTNTISSFFDLRKYENQFASDMEKDVICSKARNKNQIIWRMDVM